MAEKKSRRWLLTAGFAALGAAGAGVVGVATDPEKHRLEAQVAELTRERNRIEGQLITEKSSRRKAEDDARQYAGRLSIYHQAAKSVLDCEVPDVFAVLPDTPNGVRRIAGFGDVEGVKEVVREKFGADVAEACRTGRKDEIIELLDRVYSAPIGLDFITPYLTQKA